MKKKYVKVVSAIVAMVIMGTTVFTGGTVVRAENAGDGTVVESVEDDTVDDYEKEFVEKHQAEYAEKEAKVGTTEKIVNKVTGVEQIYSWEYADKFTVYVKEELGYDSGEWNKLTEDIKKLYSDYVFFAEDKSPILIKYTNEEERIYLVFCTFWFEKLSDVEDEISHEKRMSLMEQLRKDPRILWAGYNIERICIDDRDFFEGSDVYYGDLEELTAKQPEEKTVTNEAVKLYLLGDINGDNTITLEDASDTLKYALKITTEWSEYQKLVGDTDGDRKIMLGDVSKILRMALKIDDKITIEIPVDKGEVFDYEAYVNEYLNMQIVTDKESYSQGEEVTVTITVTNEGVHPIYMYHYHWRDNLSNMKVRFEDVSGSSIMDPEYTYAEGCMEWYKELASGESVTVQRKIPLANDLASTYVGGLEQQEFVIEADFKFRGTDWTGETLTCTRTFPLKLHNNLSTWKEVPVSDEIMYSITCGMGEFDMETMKSETDYVFRGTVVDRKHYEISWYDEEGEQWGPYTKSVIEVKINEEYYGNSLVKGDTIKIYYSMPLDADIDGNFLILEDVEYVFVTKALDAEFVADKLQNNPDDRYEQEKHADVYIGDTCYDVMLVEDEKVIFYKEYFSEDVNVASKYLSDEELVTDKMLSEYLLKNKFAALSLKDFEEAFLRIF